ncbi:MAG TPA: site-specific integrase [Thermoanaerobaculaceae bacterium]|nr:site-specific integrase [Thermoanaerobaculaceae bacterium]
MAPYRRKDGDSYYLDVRWRGYPRIRMSTGTTLKARAVAMERTLYALKAAGRADILGMVADGRLRLADVYEAWTNDRCALEHAAARAESPNLGALFDEWYLWLGSPAGISPHTHRRIALQTIRRYKSSWASFLLLLPKGRDSTLTDITRGFVADFRISRVRAVGGRKRVDRPADPLSGATLNRDLAALGSFLSWVRDVKGLEVKRPPIPREKESRGRERWLSSDELAAFERECPAEWWPFFATLFYTGARVGEGQGLRGGDVLMHSKRVSINEDERRVKTSESVRDVPIAKELEQPLAAHLARVKPGPGDLVFPGAFQNSGRLRRVWDRVCERAGIQAATPRDSRHTFGVHAAMAGIPLVRLQKLMGHMSPVMTMRYMKHAPEAYLDEDGALIAAHMNGVGDREADARADAARASLSVA